ncbi:MAG: hypothetical protein IPP57_09825 [Candidatus Obscuribacter sp.]|jgi:amino acid transporter|nr:hypothetical protein [Candidatus Obscuribacter sp.]MDQ5964224.1 hypothetical protein [Cyanobacteriota bacterium erpe_2018_sw_39hr_WHONDRS-SW48-000098_B_bin.30]MBK7837527.1 hypothetical protein [Candidatus Obscuribacter sp.]MBK9206342.1 hypothetical protein [Candidatus Obscuribacter sp.]MBK9618244.1 hypothetical protein [Candidatus Obscuribacter sp.]
MSNSTKLILLGLAICVVLGIVLQSVIAGVMQQSMSGQELLTPDQMAKKIQKDALKEQKERALKNK